MKLLLIIVLLLTTSSTIFCQNTTRTKVVKVSTLKKIKKDLDKCDSLRVAYNLQLKTFNELVISNLDYFKQVRIQQTKVDKLQVDLDASVKALRKKKKSWLLPTSAGIVGGLILGVIISKE